MIHKRKQESKLILYNSTALVTIVPKEKLTINGPIKKWSGKGSSGKAVHRLFCSECGSPIAHDPDVAPEIISLKAGTLDMELKKKLKPVRNKEADHASYFLCGLRLMPIQSC